MIYIVTGSPGTGKTSLALSWINKNHDGLFKASYEEVDGSKVECNRPIYINHIDNVNHEHFNSHDISDEDLMRAPLHMVVPCATKEDPSVISPVVIVDEAYRIYPNRSSSKAVPEYVEKLAELRHHGLTLILLCQQPSQLDPFVRSMAAKHYHIHRQKVGSSLYQLYHCASSVSPSAFKDAIKEDYKPPKEVFNYYHSSTMHVKFKKKIPKILFIFPLLLVMAAVFIYLAVGSVKNMALGGQDAENSEFDYQSELDDSTMAEKFASDTVRNTVTGITETAPKNKQAIAPEDFAPRMIDKPETAPIYDGIRQVKSMEMIVGCVKTSNSCNCYSDQATVINVPNGTCEQILKDGVYNPFLAPPSERFAKETKKTEKVTEKAAKSA